MSCSVGAHTHTHTQTRGTDAASFGRALFACLLLLACLHCFMMSGLRRVHLCVCVEQHNRKPSSSGASVSCGLSICSVANHNLDRQASVGASTSSFTWSSGSTVSSSEWQQQWCMQLCVQCSLVVVAAAHLSAVCAA